MGLLLLSTYGQRDFQYLAKQLGEVINVDSPLSEEPQTRPIRQTLENDTGTRSERCPAPEYLAMLRVMDEEDREQRRAAKQKRRRRMRHSADYGARVLRKLADELEDPDDLEAEYARLLVDKAQQNAASRPTPQSAMAADA